MAVPDPWFASRPEQPNELMPPSLRLGEELPRGKIGDTWRGRMGGIGVAAKLVRVGVAEHEEFMERMGRVAELRVPQLVPVLATVRDAKGLWVVSRFDAGVPLSALIQRHKLRPPVAVAVGLGILNALSTLHEAGFWHGAVHGGNVHIGPDGSVRLSDFAIQPLAPEALPRLWVEDVKAVGRVLCELLRVSTSSPSADSTASKLALAAFAARLSTGTRQRKGGSAYLTKQVAVALWEAAGAMGTNKRQAAAKKRLGEFVAAMLSDAEAGAAELTASASWPGIRKVRRPMASASDVRTPRKASPSRVDADTAPGPQPAPPATPVVLAPSRPARRWPSSWQVLAPVGAVAAMAVAALLLNLTHSDGRRPAPATVAIGSAVSTVPGPSIDAVLPPATPEPRADPTPAASPPPIDAGLLPADGDVASVAIRADGCSAGAACATEVDVALRPVPYARPVSWSLVAVDVCSGARTLLGSGSVTARAGWTLVIGITSVVIPADGQMALLAITERPGRAASSPLSIGTRTAC